MKVGILGAGRIAAIMADTVSRMRGAEMYAVASRNMDKAMEFASIHHVTRPYGSYEDMLSDKAVELVYIATPHPFHFEHAKMCIDAGKPVLVEKPFCVNAKEAEELLSYAKKKGVFITEAMWVRYMPMADTIKKLLKDGVIGTPKMIMANLSYPMLTKERLIKADLAGGALLDVGVYALTFADLFKSSEVDDIYAVAVMTKEGVDAHDSITIRYKDGSMAVLNTSMQTVGDRKGIIQGTEGVMIIENINNYETITVFDKDYKKKLFKKAPKQITGYEYEIEACKKAIKWHKKECSEMPHETTMLIMKQMDEIRKQIDLKYPFE
ncbi:MAG: Gfo/Idh/MocA family oxidoreductase [Lachnospiraceae bacterium]|nr:Gfo/Idh/MocA family oxidoreductase [Lachnospiraceae bacterium]